MQTDRSTISRSLRWGDYWRRLQGFLRETLLNESTIDPDDLQPCTDRLDDEALA